jgi:hypothetical protein
LTNFADVLGKKMEFFNIKIEKKKKKKKLTWMGLYQSLFLNWQKTEKMA